MTEDREAILAKIKKILALARKNPNVNEATAAAAKAQELIFQYNLSEEEVDAFKTREERITEQFYAGHRAGVNEVQWKIQLASAVAINNLCKILHHPWKREISWIGKESNIVVATYLFETLCVDLENIAEKLWQDILRVRNTEKQSGLKLFKDPTLRTVHGKTWKKSFFIGAVKSISERLSENLKDLRRNRDNLNTLVVINDGDVRKYIADTYGTLGRGSSMRGALHGSAYGTGVAVGKKVQFKRGMGAGGSSGPSLLGEG